MAETRFSNFVNKLIAGKEKDEGYARASLPSNRWELFWDIVKGSFWKIVLINVLTVIFLIPFFLLFVFRSIGLSNLGASFPYSLPFGIGYGAPVSFSGIAEGIVFNVNSIVFLFMPIAMIIGSLGISGGAYVIRNMIWTEGIFVANDFWRGIKQNYKQILLITIVYSVVFYMSVIGVCMADRVIAMGAENSWIYTVSKIISIVILVFYTMMTFHMITMSVTYELKFFDLIKNAFLFTIGLPIQNIIFIFLASIPFLLLLLGEVLVGIGVALIITFGVSYFLLVWTDYTHWIFDKYINVKIKGAKTNRGIYEKVGKSDDSEAIKQYRARVEAVSNSTMFNKPIKPITDEEIKLAELPVSFSRADLEKLQESKDAMYEDHKRYVEEHMNDERYKKVAEQNQEEDVEKQKRIEKAKKELAKRNKK